ncbi:MAG: hypothetical protein JXR88_15440 [Clostridia bacterium]|nr:hypothetical protein [Clostridia bacterium]
MKKILLTLMILILVGCSEEHKEIPYTLEDVHPMPMEKNEVTSHFVYDPWMPLYAELTSYPDESLIDWNEDTYQVVSKSDTLQFVFTKVEAVYGIHVISESMASFMIKTGTFEKEVRGQNFTFETPIITDNLTLIPLGEEPFNLMECHILVGRILDEDQYDTYKAKNIFLKDLQNKYQWMLDPYDNFNLACEVVNLYDLDLLMEVSNQVDYSLLSEEALGLPIEIIGQVIHVTENENLTEVTLKAIGCNEEIIVFTKQNVTVDNMFMTTGIYLGEIMNKFFYDIK